MFDENSPLARIALFFVIVAALYFLLQALIAVGRLLV